MIRQKWENESVITTQGKGTSLENLSQRRSTEIELLDLSDGPEHSPIPLPPFWEKGPRLSHRSMKRQIYRDLVYRAINLTARILLAVGYNRAARWASKMLRIGHRFQKSDRRETEKNLTDCLGDETTEAERREIAANVFHGVAILGVQALWTCRWDELVSNIRIELEGRENLEAALANGKGAIGLSAHFGNWEIMAVVVAQLGYPANVVARQMKDPRFDAWVNQVRESLGVHVIARGNEGAKVIRALRNGELLGLLIDLDTRSGPGIFVDFFGRPAYTQTGPFILARKMGSVLLPSLCYREGVNHLRISFDQPWEVSVTDNEQEDILRATQRATRFLEEKIRERPEQWAWFHKRWKTTPDKVKGKRK